ncbi:DUF3761 domain-containing protein [Mycobacterium sp. SMC-14]|uniref:DUF3761 domain-containing protein n=1 Tax=Mycobacterium sp. SMC-14 TaxID=3385968 RepID=UPI00390C803A
MHIRVRIIAVTLVIGLTALVGAPSVVAIETATVWAGCGTGYYENSDGQCIHDPSSGLPPGGAPGFLDGGGAPPGAAAICRDGDYSFSTHHSGTCSRHGGVRQWLTN